MLRIPRSHCGANLRVLQTAVAPKRTLLVIEELESRALLSASAPAGWVAEPNLFLQPAATGGKAPYSPYQIRHAYGLDKLSLDGSGQTIAIVDAYDHPNILSDLQQFDRAFGLPDPVFTKATPQGQPAVDNGWAGEIALDVEWAHAIAPRAHILLVEAKSASDSDLLAAVDYARNAPGVVAVSMSWGGSEFVGETGFDSHFTTPAGHQGVTFVASSGDSGASTGPEWPSVSANVLAVGGTSLTLTTQNIYSSETAWSGSGGGTSKYMSEPSYQNSVQSSGFRTTPDVAYDANPSTGFYVYVSIPQSGRTGWFSFGGTSAGAPQWAAIIAVADQGLANEGKGSLANAQAVIYSLPASDFHDITSGSNGLPAHTGYDLVTGRGSPVADRVIADLMKATSFAVTKHTKASPINGSVSGLSRQSANATDDAMASLIVQDGVPGNRPTIPIPTSQPVLDQLLSSNTDILSYEMDHIRGGFSNLLASDVIHGPRLSVEGFSEYGNLWESILSPKLMKD